MVIVLASTSIMLLGWNCMGSNCHDCNIQVNFVGTNSLVADELTTQKKEEKACMNFLVKINPVCMIP